MASFDVIHDGRSYPSHRWAAVRKWASMTEADLIAMQSKFLRTRRRIV